MASRPLFQDVVDLTQTPYFSNKLKWLGHNVIESQIPLNKNTQFALGQTDQIDYSHLLKLGPPATKRYLECVNPHPMDKRIVSLSEPHIYFIDGQNNQVLSCTEFVHAFFPAFDKTETAHQILESKTFTETAHRPSYKYHNCKTITDILMRWSEWSELGTMLHDNIESYINGELDTDVVPPNRIPFDNFIKLYRDPTVWKWRDFRTEWSIFDEDTKLAGKIDYVGIDPQTSKLIIIDWKRVRTISNKSYNTAQGQRTGYSVCFGLHSCNFTTYSLQLNVYKWILEKNYNVSVSKLWLLQLHPNVKEPVLYPVPDFQSIVAKMVGCRKIAIRKK